METGNGQPRAQLVLTGVVAYVDVWSSSRTENYSEAFTQQLFDMGAKVSKTFSKQVTHVIFKDGHWSTWNRAQKTGIKLVSVLWVEKCREVGAYVDESLYPAINTNEGLPQQIIKHKCMQPRDFVEKTPENDRRLQKRLKTMVKDLDVQKAATEKDIPVLLFEDNGSLLYSPARKIKYECNAMERRIKDMKEKRENLSPTASQMSPVSGFSSVQATQEPVLDSASSSQALSEEESSDPLNSSFSNLWGISGYKSLRKKSSKPSFEVSDTPGVSAAGLGSSPFFMDNSKNLSPRQPGGKRLQKSMLQPKILEVDFHSKEAEFETPSPQKHSDLPHANKLACRGSSEKMIHVESVESSSVLSCSEMDTERVTDFPSTNLNFSPLKSDCASGSKQRRPKRRSGIKLNTSPLCRREFQNDFLQAVLTPTKCNIDQDTSYEDYFSPSNLNTSKVEVTLPFPSMPKLQNPSRMPYNCSLSQTKQEAVLQKSSTKEKTVSRKRKKVVDNNESIARSDCMQSVSSHSKDSATLKCLLPGGKVNTVENPDCLLNLNFQKKMHITIANRCPLTTGDENKFFMCDVKDGSSESFHNQAYELKEKSETSGKIKKPLKTLVMTSMSPDQKTVVVQVGKKLGGFLFSSEVCENTSHVVAGSPRRTLNILLGIARGCWIVSYEWVLWSLEYGHWISEEPYELSIDFPAAPICRVQHHLSNRECHQKLFSDQPVMFISLTSQPPFKKLCELIQLCGGRVCKTLRQAELCIGKCRVGKHAEVQCLSEKWILDSIIQNKVCPFESYIFQNKN